MIQFVIHVLINVTTVLDPKITVPIVLKTESINHSVLVHKDTSTMDLIQNVKLVPKDVSLVNHVTNVKLVLPEELMPHIVDVQPVPPKPVLLLELISVTLLVTNQPVSHVPLNVKNVTLTQVIVPNVPVTELTQQNVTVLKDTMILVPPIVHNVPLNALLVKTMPITVPSVPKEELTHHPVHVQMELISMETNVLTVLHNV
jgi:hypothetical protein